MNKQEKKSLLETTKKLAKELEAVIVDRLPKLPAEAGDLLYNSRELRHKVQKLVDALETQEKALKDFFINNLPKSKANGITGKVAHIELDKKIIPTVENWENFYNYVKKHDAFELLQRRLSESAVKERWDDNQVIPGVGKFTAVTVSCTKRK